MNPCAICIPRMTPNTFPHDPMSNVLAFPIGLYRASSELLVLRPKQAVLGHVTLHCGGSLLLAPWHIAELTTSKHCWHKYNAAEPFCTISIDAGPEAPTPSLTTSPAPEDPNASNYHWVSFFLSFAPPKFPIHSANTPLAHCHIGGNPKSWNSEPVHSTQS